MNILSVVENISFRHCPRLIQGTFLVAIILTAKLAHAQSKTNRVVYVSDFAIRTMDAISTGRLLNSPCRCFAEADPMAPGAKSSVVIFMYQAAFSLGTITTSRMLEKHHHARIARLLVIADIISESYIVQHNMRIKEPKRGE
jgi:hypothetical protein